MNPIELLMAEHAALRVYFRHLRDLDTDYLFEIDDFILGCHARVEDEVVFPALRKMRDGGADKVETVTKRLEEEHRLVQMLSNSMRATVAENQAPLSRDKVTLYASTVESHNSSEESLVFSGWNKLDENLRLDSVDRIKAIVKEFGVARYLRTTGFSEDFFALLK